MGKKCLNLFELREGGRGGATGSTECRGGITGGADVVLSLIAADGITADISTEPSLPISRDVVTAKCIIIEARL